MMELREIHTRVTVNPENSHSFVTSQLPVREDASLCRQEQISAAAAKQEMGIRASPPSHYKRGRLPQPQVGDTTLKSWH